MRSGYVSEHWNPVSLRYRSNMAAEHVVVIFGLKVEDAFDTFEEVQTKIKEIDDR